MVQRNRFICGLLRVALFATLTRLFSLAGIRIGHIVGTSTSFFAGGSVMAPLAGVFGSVFECGALSAIYAALSIWRGIPAGHPGTYGIASFFAALYWAKPSVWTRLVVPAACMLLFFLHPVGHDAFAYTFYWFVPMALYLLRRNSVYFNALGSTFVQHAVGSVIYLYSKPMAPQVWLELIPAVARERLLIAAWMLAVYAIARLGYVIWWCYLARYVPRVVSEPLTTSEGA